MGLSTERLSRAQKILGIAAALTVLVGTCAGYTAGSARIAAQLLGLERRARVDSIAAQLRSGGAAQLQVHQLRQDSINLEILRRLDCALFELPRHCRETLSPR